MSFLRLAKGVPDSYEVLLAEMPGRGFRHAEVATDSLVSYARELDEALKLIPGKPTVYLGHSLGALVAYELARLNPPQRLIVSACRSPSELHTKNEFLQQSSFSDQELLGYMRDFGNLPKEMSLGEEEAKFFLPILRADLLLLRGYQKRAEPLDCKLWAIGGDSDSIVSSSDLDHWQKFGRDFEKKIYPGGHFFPWESVVMADLFHRLEGQ